MCRIAISVTLKTEAHYSNTAHKGKDKVVRLQYVYVCVFVCVYVCMCVYVYVSACVYMCM